MDKQNIYTPIICNPETIKQLSNILRNVETLEDINKVISFIKQNRNVVNHVFHSENTILHLIAKKYIPSIILPHIEQYIRYETFNLYNLPDNAGDTPLMAAVNSDNLGAAITLLTSQQRVLEANNYTHDKSKEEMAYTVNLCNNAGQTPLHIIARYHNFSIMHYLLALGASPLAQDVYGNTPAHMATFNKNFPNDLQYALCKFASHGVNPFTINILGKTIIDSAYENSISYNPTIAFNNGIETSTHLWTEKNTNAVLDIYNKYVAHKSESFVVKLLTERNQTTNAQIFSPGL